MRKKQIQNLLFRENLKNHQANTSTNVRKTLDTTSCVMEAGAPPLWQHPKPNRAYLPVTLILNLVMYKAISPKSTNMIPAGISEAEE